MLSKFKGVFRRESDNLVPELIYKIARTPEERTAAFRLVYQSYLDKGLIEPNRWKLRTTPFHLLPTTSVFVALHRRVVASTVSLIGDGLLGLPIEQTYPEVVWERRNQGLYVGEVTSLAVRDIDFKRFLPVFIQLTRLMAQHARAHGMDQFLIAVHPKHARFYQRFMGFEQVGPLREYPTVCNAPAVACCLDFHRIDRERPVCYDEYFGEPIPASELQLWPMSEDESERFRPAAEISPQHIPILV